MNQDRDHILRFVMKTTLSLVWHHDHLALVLIVRTCSRPLPTTWLNHADQKVQRALLNHFHAVAYLPVYVKASSMPIQ
jgi:hypothetical protein